MSAEQAFDQDKLKLEQVQILEELTAAGMWTDISPQMFPLIPDPLVNHAREAAMDNRDEYLTEERIPQIRKNLLLFIEDEKISTELSEQQAECMDELRDIIMARDSGEYKGPLAERILAEAIDIRIQQLTERLEIYKGWASVDIGTMPGLANKAEARQSLDELSEKSVKETENLIDILSKRRSALREKGL